MSKVTILKKNKLQLLSFFVLFVFSMVSCYREDRVKPIQQSTSNNNNSVSNTTPAKLSYITFNTSDKVDSNFNKAYTSLSVDVQATFTGSGNVKCQIYAHDYGDVHGVYRLVYASGLMSIPESQVVSIKFALYADSVLKYLDRTILSYPFELIVKFEDETGNSLGGTSGSRQLFQLERVLADRKYYFPFKLVSPVYGDDLNKDGYYQPFNKLNFSFENVDPNLKANCYLKVFYKDYSNVEHPYGKSQVFRVDGSNTTIFSDVEIVKEYTQLPFMNTVVIARLFNAKTDDFISESSFLYSFDSFENDTRTFTLEELDMVTKDDLNNNTFPSSYTISLKIASSDGVEESLLTSIDFNIGLITYTISLGSIKSGIRSEFIITSDELLTKGIYDLSIRSINYRNYKTVGSWGKQQFSILGDAKFEKISEDK